MYKAQSFQRWREYIKMLQQYAYILRKNNGNNALHLYFLGILASIEILMSFSFLGFFHIAPISITIAYMPILIAGCLLGPLDAAFIGLLFGLASMYKASASYVLPGDKIFSPFLSGNPMESIIISVGSRVLFGLIIGLLYLKAHKSKKHPLIWIAVVSFIAKDLHSVLVYTSIWLTMPELGYTPFSAFRDYFNIGDFAAMISASCVVLFCLVISRTRLWKNLCHNIAAAREMQQRYSFHKIFQGMLIFIMLGFSIALAGYFAQRISFMLHNSDFEVSPHLQFDLFMLQVQFMIGMIALSLLLSLLLRMSHLNSIFKKHELTLDELTKIFNRKQFFPLCTEAIKNMNFAESPAGYFLIMDVDHFKTINDTYGHMEGDRILRELSNVLKKYFADIGIVGRLGGDEFAVLINKPLQYAELESTLQNLLADIHRIPCSDTLVTCSIGVCPINEYMTVNELYEKTDIKLYESKENGRNQFTIDTSVTNSNMIFA